MHILVVDDDVMMIELLRHCLEEQGMLVSTARSPPEALICIQEGQIDLIVSDIVMPGGGAELLLANLQTTRPDLPVIVMSGYGSKDFNLPRERTRGFWRKGDTFERLLDLVRRL